jgi:hypothetical protein
MEALLQNVFGNQLNTIHEDEYALDFMLAQERIRRTKAEGPPAENYKIETLPDGTKLKIRENGQPWAIDRPCTKCTDDECMNYLIELSETTPVLYNGSMCYNPLNNDFLRFLCAWRKHVKNTFIIEQAPGSDKWKRTSICTSELTFLGRASEMGGILGVASKTRKHICSLPSLVSLMDKEEGHHGGVKCLSAGFALLIAMYMDWTLYTEENANIIDRLLKKVKKNGATGLMTYNGTPWYTMFKCILERRRIPDKLKELILSRAHLP